MTTTVPARRRTWQPGSALRSLARPVPGLRRHRLSVDRDTSAAGRGGRLRLAETDDAYVLTVPVTGEVEDLDAELWGRRLRVTGRRTRRERAGWLRWRRRPVGWLRVDVLLPTPGDPAATQARRQGDELTVRVAKRPQDRRHRIPVT